jgi:hypothetical protein
MNAVVVAIHLERAKGVAALQERRWNRRKIAALRTARAYFRLMSSTYPTMSQAGRVERFQSTCDMH